MYVTKVRKKERNNHNNKEKKGFFANNEQIRNKIDELYVFVSVCLYKHRERISIKDKNKNHTCVSLFLRKKKKFDIMKCTTEKQMLRIPQLISHSVLDIYSADTDYPQREK